MTDELKCLAHPCDGVMEANLYDASLTCSKCQFQVADESEYTALVAGRQAAIDDETQNPWKAAIIDKLIVDCIYSKGHESDPRRAFAEAIAWNVKVALDPSASKEARDMQQAAIDAALENIEDALNAEGRYDSADLVRSRKGANPLAEAQAKIKELNGLCLYHEGFERELRTQMTELEAENADLTKKLEAGWVRACQTSLGEAYDRISELERERDRAIQHHERCAEKLFKAERELAKQLERNKLLRHANSLFANSGDNDELAIDQLRRELAEARKNAERYEAKLFALGAMEEPPCFKCGYNGPGYFQAATHPCAHNHHNAMLAEREKE